MKDAAGLIPASADQKTFLASAKRALSAGEERLTWDQFAARIGVEPRALKTYRMPATSSDFRTMPRLLVEKIESLVRDASAPGAAAAAAREPDVAEWTRANAPMKLLPASLAALVTRQARQVFMGGGASMVSGVDRLWTGGSGLEIGRAHV